MDDANNDNDEIPVDLWHRIFKFFVYDIIDGAVYCVYYCAVRDIYCGDIRL